MGPYREKDEADDPDPYGQAIRTALVFAEPCAEIKGRI
jgi:hypothetical protein